MKLVSGQPVWPRSITVKAESYWLVKIEGSRDARVGPEGSPLQNDPRAAELPAPKFPRWALIARWVILPFDTAEGDLRRGNLPTRPIGEWFLVGSGGTFPLPIPFNAKATPRPLPRALQAYLGALQNRGELNYDPLVALQYMCNEYPTEHGDNSGWLHVYQNWNW